MAKKKDFKSIAVVQANLLVPLGISMASDSRQSLREKEDQNCGH